MIYKIKLIKSNIFIIMLILIFNLSIFHIYANDFYKDSKRGWYWFEENTKIQKQLTPENAKNILDQFKRRLESAKYLVFADPTPENAAAYMEAEDAIWRYSAQVTNAFEIAKFLYPQYANLDKNPMNVPAIRIRRDIEEDNNYKLGLNLAKEFDLVLFRSSNCKYCQAFEPVLKSFGDKYSFNIEAVSNDENLSRYFPTKYLPNLFNVLHVELLPIVVMVHKFKPIRFEFTRGMMTESEIEGRMKLVNDYLHQQSK